MRIAVICKSCKKEQYLKSSAKDRPQLEMQYGKEVDFNCNSCGIFNRVHINRVSAVVDNRIVIGGVLLGFVASAILFMFFGLFAMASIGLPFVIWRWEMKKAHDFNTYRIMT